MRLRFIAWALALLSCVAHAAPVQLIDDRGITLQLPAPPRRIVSTLPSLTESICALGACDRLVGVDRYSNWPDSVRALPQAGGGIDPNVEAIVALKPDVVLVARSSRVIERLEALGLKVVVLEPQTHADVHRVLQQIAQLLASAEAEAVWRTIDTAVAAAAQSLPPSARGTRVYFEISDVPYAAGEASFIGETLARLGARNIVPRAMGPFPKLNPEYVVRADPQLIMGSERSLQGLPKRPGWGAIGAVKTGRICRFTPEQSDMLVRPGPRMADAARLMAQCLAR